MEIISQSQILFEQLHQFTRASASNCHQVADRIIDEVTRICQESRRIQISGEVANWTRTLADHRLQKCLHYYKLGSKQGRIELQSILSAMIYHYISSTRKGSSYQARVALIEDFLQGFYVETLKTFRREANLVNTYTPRTLLELAEYMAFSERYAKRRISLPGRKSQQLIILRVQTFAHKQPSEITVDINSLDEGNLQSTDNEWDSIIIQRLRTLLVKEKETEPLENLDRNLRETVIKELINYLEERKQSDCTSYLILCLKDLSANEIEQILGLTSRQRDYLRQRLKYHLIRFALSSHWKLVHQWLEADLDRNFGLTPTKWQLFQKQLTLQQSKLLYLVQQGIPNKDIAKKLSLSNTKVEKQWFKVLELAWNIRNQSL